MRKARSQLSKLTQLQAGNQGAFGNQEGYQAIGSEVDEIQRRLDALQLRQPMPNPDFQQPQANPYAAPNMPVESPHLHRSHNAASPKLDNIRSALEQMTSKLQSMNSANATGSNNQKAVLQQTDILKQHYNHISAELQELKNSIAGVVSSSNSEAGLEAIQETLSADYRAIMQELERSKNSEMDASLFSSALEASHKELSKQIVDMKQSIDSTLSNPNAYAQTLEVSHDDITKRLEDLYQAMQTSIATPDSYVDAIENNHQELSKQILQLQQVVENLDNGSSDATPSEISSVEMRLEEITRAIVALSLNDGNVNNLERIEARVSDMAKTLDGFSLQAPEVDHSDFERLEAKLSDIQNLMGAGSPEFESMEAQIGKLPEKLENLASVSMSAPLSGDENNSLLQRMDELVDQISQSQTQSHSSNSNDQMAQQLEHISAAIDNLSTPSGQSDNGNNATNEIIVQQLEQIAGAIDQLASPSSENLSASGLASIEQQLTEISSQLSGASQTGDISLDPIASRLTGIEEQLGANRDITIELASKVAEDAVKMSVQAMPKMAAGDTQMDTSVLSSMSELLAQINNKAETSNSTNVEAFGAVTQTLDLMVERLGNIETGLSGHVGAHAADQDPIPVAVAENLAQPPQDFVPAESTLVAPEPELAVPTPEPDPEQEPVKEEMSKSARNPAADLVKAARMAAASSQVDAPVIAEPEIETPHAESIEQQDFEASAQEIAEPEFSDPEPIDVETPELPADDTPAMVMDPMVEGQSKPKQEGDPDVALEPGSGGPDLAALVRQANEQRKNNRGSGIDSSGTEFIAAARRAAQAAAQEAGVVEEEIGEKTSKSLFASLPSLFAKRKKVIIMAAAAALFVVLATTLSAKFLGGGESQTAEVENSVQLEETVSDVPLQASTVPAQNTVTPIETTTESGTVEENVDEVAPLDVQPDIQSVAEEQEAPKLAQEVNLASVNLNENPAPASFVLADELNFVSAELKEAVQNGEPAALFEIGKRYTDGTGTEKNLKKAAEWYERAANMGFAPAQYIIGNFNEKGLGVDKDPAVAAQWYEQAARGGNIIAMHNLAVLTATPNALSAEPNMSEAFKWFSNAADYGVRDSQVNAGIFHTKGFGTEVNLVEAYKWFAIAAKAGDKDAGNKRDVIANAIQPDQLEVAKSLVNDWKPMEVVEAANEVPVTEAWKAPEATVAAPAIKIDRSVIAQTQILLSKVGFNAGVADGVMGQKTRNAVAAFQQKAGLPVNGQIDSEFLKALKAVAI